MLIAILGTISQWGEVSKTKKDRSRSKVKDATIAESLNQTSRVSRGGRAGIDSGRGGRGRATDRGRDGRARGASAAHTNGSRNKENVETSMPTTDSNAWDTLGTSADASSWDTVGKTAKSAEEPPTGWGSTTADWGSTTAEWGYTAADAASATAAVAANVTSSIIPDGVKKSWASIFTKPTLPQAPKAHELPAKYFHNLLSAAIQLTLLLGLPIIPNLKGFPNFPQSNLKPQFLSLHLSKQMFQPQRNRRSSSLRSILHPRRMILRKTILNRYPTPLTLPQPLLPQALLPAPGILGMLVLLARHTHCNMVSRKPFVHQPVGSRPQL